MDLSKLEKIKFLGNGFHGYVYLVKYRKKEYALKVSYINPEDLNNYNINLDKKIELSVTGFYNDISNTYIDNSIICFKW